MRPIQERLAGLAADLREDSRQAGIAAAEAKPHVEQAAVDMGETRKAVESLERQLDELQRALTEAHAAHKTATDYHAACLADLARHERDGQKAADVASELDALAVQHAAAPALLPPHEALAATGLMHDPPKVVEVAQVTDLGKPSDLREQDNGLAPPPVPHDPAGQPVATGPPDMTMPDLGPKRPPLDPPPGDGTHTHAKPADSLMSRVTGGFKALVTRDEQDGDQ